MARAATRTGAPGSPIVPAGARSISPAFDLRYHHVFVAARLSYGEDPGVRQLGWIWLAGLFLLAALETAAAQPRRVLLLHSFGPHFAPWNMMASQFRDE